MNNNYSVVAVGYFDAIHLAHQKIITTAVDIAKEHNLIPKVCTFSLNYAKSDLKGTGYLFSHNNRIGLIKGLGIASIFMPAFDDIKRLSPTDFFERILIKQLEAKYIVCGYDYRFGHESEGDVELLKKLCNKHGINLVVVEKQTLDDVTIGARLIKQSVAEGHMEEARHLLGFNYFLTGIVVKGKQLGQTIGFPTANIHFRPHQILPRYGVYSSIVTIDGETFNGVTNVGVKPTLDGVVPLCETFIIDFDRDIYDVHIKVELKKMLRLEHKFASIVELKSAIKKDVASVTNGL